eukprot:TRINITY_DN13759_c0_g1_i1.p2 TRINITY_DN13759_c0_g1~~TRINITY_DN13759_c0_g1_i1.p2  ORF type:complete len:80 (-),score=7.65 TRINITY_DN13759_c0_g1_i1:87-326(-)
MYYTHRRKIRALASQVLLEEVKVSKKYGYKKETTSQFLWEKGEVLVPKFVGPLEVGVVRSIQFSESILDVVFLRSSFFM